MCLTYTTGHEHFNSVFQTEPAFTDSKIPNGAEFHSEVIQFSEGRVKFIFDTNWCLSDRAWSTISN